MYWQYKTVNAGVDIERQLRRPLGVNLANAYLNVAQTRDQEARRCGTTVYADGRILKRGMQTIFDWEPSGLRIPCKTCMDSCTVTVYVLWESTWYNLMCQVYHLNKRFCPLPSFSQNHSSYLLTSVFVGLPVPPVLFLCGLDK